MKSKISVIIKEPGKNPRHVAISAGLENLQGSILIPNIRLDALPLPSLTAIIETSNKTFFKFLC